MEHTVQPDPGHAVALRWVKSFMRAWTQMDPMPEDVDRHAVAPLAGPPYRRKMDLDARAVARWEWAKDGGVSCCGVLS